MCGHGHPSTVRGLPNPGNPPKARVMGLRSRSACCNIEELSRVCRKETTCAVIPSLFPAACMPVQGGRFALLFIFLNFKKMMRNLSYFYLIIYLFTYLFWSFFLSSPRLDGEGHHSEGTVGLSVGMIVNFCHQENSNETLEETTPQSHLATLSPFT